MVAVAGSAVQAGNLEIQLTGVDLIYDGTGVYDAVNPLGGVGDPALADPLNSMSFLLDGTLIGTLTSDIAIDVRILGVQNIPVGGGMVYTTGNADSFGVDLLIGGVIPAWGLALNIDQFQVYYSGYKIAMATSGAAASLISQNLPFLVAFTEPIDTIAIVLSSAKLSNVTDNGVYLTGFEASGTGNISGEGYPVPEPSLLTLLGLGIVPLLRRRGV